MEMAKLQTVQGTLEFKLKDLKPIRHCHHCEWKTKWVKIKGNDFIGKNEPYSS